MRVRHADSPYEKMILLYPETELEEDILIKLQATGLGSIKYNAREDFERLQISLVDLMGRLLLGKQEAKKKIKEMLLRYKMIESEGAAKIFMAKILSAIDEL